MSKLDRRGYMKDWLLGCLLLVVLVVVMEVVDVRLLSDCCDEMIAMRCLS